ncbi:hypothetical protein BV22DRAFT_671631 [Leucogyrophana mollusca]|uniref:Uncharacterized protein n=1 Tax=Leucogyrophana mollusca TaxID=85980 RepID=A0ACB8B8W7_9AGAM|nr:hypothetical protein BV22DRAFT_671631 [Leucogyrophana mollusca]
MRRSVNFDPSLPPLPEGALRLTAQIISLSVFAFVTFAALLGPRGPWFRRHLYHGSSPYFDMLVCYLRQVAGHMVDIFRTDHTLSSRTARSFRATKLIWNRGPQTYTSRR